MSRLTRTSVVFSTALALAGVVATPGAGASKTAKRARLGHSLRSYLAPARAPARLDVPCADANQNAEGADANAFASTIFCLVNRERARRGLGALAARPVLQSAGTRHVVAMVAQDFFGHAAPGGVSYRQRIVRAGYYRSPAIGFIAGENIAWMAGTAATPQRVVEGWMASPEHRAEVLNPRFRDAGVGVTLASPPSLGDSGVPGVTCAMEFGALAFKSARVARASSG